LNIDNPDHLLKRWKKVGLGATIAIILSVSIYLGIQATRKPVSSGPTSPLFVGSEGCRECHQKEYETWKGSHHALAMLAPRQDLALLHQGQEVLCLHR
jgi:hypothetical protein